MLRYLLMLLALLCLGATTARGADAPRAWLDRDSMQLGETVTLNIETTQSGSEPDFSALQADFELLGRSSSSSVSIVNGTSSSTLLWAVGLKPRREGKLTIPPLSVGSARTAALSLDVVAAPAPTSAGSGDDFFIELSADPRAAYVQQQMRVTVKFFYAVNLTDGAVEELEVAGAVVQKLGQDRSYDVERSGRRYRVLERRYAVKAEKSGALQLPAINFRGRALNGNDPNALFFGRGRSVSTRSEALSVDIRPRPAESASGAWLPAQSLELRAEGVDSSSHAKVGEPLTLTVTAVAQGLGFEQLPELELPAIDGAEVYPDKSVTRSRESNGWIIGERSRKFAIVPKRAGTLQIAPLQLNWWDTAGDRAALAQTPALTIEVAAGRAGPAAPTDSTVPAARAAADAGDGQAARFWRRLALASFALWLLSVAAVLLRSRRRPAAAVAAAPSFSPTRRSFEQAVAANDAAAAAQRLLAWARSEGLAVTHLGALAAALESTAQRAAIAHLQAALYAGDPAAGLPPDLAACFAGGFARRPAAASADATSVLPPLWSGGRSGPA